MCYKKLTMESGVVFFVALLFYITPVKGAVKYEVNTDLYPWTTANSMCTLAIPPLVTSTTNNVTLDFSDSEALTLAEGEELWLGYVRRPLLLQYIGCMAHDPSQYSMSSSYEVQTNLGHCASRCNMTKYVAIMRTECFCMNTLPSVNIKRTTCTDPCEDDTGMLCGGRSSLSIYEAVELSDPSVISEHRTVSAAGNCVAYHGNSKAYTYTRCSLSFSSKCSSDTGSVSVLTGYMAWKTMVSECIEAQLSPISFSTAATITDPYNIWTGLARVNKMVSVHTNYGQSMLPATARGYVRYQNGQYFLRFQTDTTTTPTSRGFLCQTDVTTAIPMTTKAQSVQSASTNLLALYILLPILVLLLLGIIIFYIIWRRRRQGREILSKWYQKRKSQSGINNQVFLASQLHNAHHDTNGDVPHETILAYKEPIPDSDFHDGHDYDVTHDGHNGLVATIPLDHDTSDPGSDHYSHLRNPNVGKNMTSQNTYDRVPGDGNHDEPDNKRNGNEYAKISKSNLSGYTPNQMDVGTYNVLSNDRHHGNHLPANSTYVSTRFGPEPIDRAATLPRE